MKKLMIVACAVAVAAIANAGSFSWSVSNVAGFGGGDSTGYQAWLIENYTGTIDASNFATVIADYGKADDWGGIETGYTDGSSSDWGGNTTVNAKVLVIDAGAIADAEHFYVTDAKSSTSDGNAVFNPGNLAFDANATSTASNWTAVAPEPTSGLLLLLGMAGLALRRRRA